MSLPGQASACGLIPACMRGDLLPILKSRARSRTVRSETRSIFICPKRSSSCRLKRSRTHFTRASMPAPRPINMRYGITARGPFLTKLPLPFGCRQSWMWARCGVRQDVWSASMTLVPSERAERKSAVLLDISKAYRYPARGHLIKIRISGDGFLKHMVRIIVGTLIAIGRGKLPIKHMISLLDSRDRKESGPTAKPHGLTLLKVSY